MISVQSRQLRSSGSKLLFLLLCAFMTACSASKKSTQTKPQPEAKSEKQVYNPSTGQYEDANEGNTQVDTVQWEEVTEIPPITDEVLEKTIGDGELKDRYQVALLLPMRGEFLNTDLGRVNKQTQKFVHYYEGFVMGAKKLEREGISLDIEIIDVGSMAQEELAQMNRLSEFDLIIGPYRKENIEQVLPLLDDQSTPLVTPWNSFASLADNRKNFIMMKPGFTTYCDYMVDDILAKFNPRDVRIITKENQYYLSEFFYRPAAQKYNLVDTSVSFKSYLINDATMDLKETPIDSQLYEDRPNVFIIPYYRTSDQQFVYSLLRKLSIGNNNYDIHVYGMPQWKEWVEQDYDLFNSMNIYIPDIGLTNTQSFDYQQIRKRILGQYNELPTDDALEAYDLIVHFGRMLFKYGTGFAYYLDAESYQDPVFSEFQFEKRINLTSPRSIDDRLQDFDGFENKYVTLIQLKDFRFRRVGNSR